MMIIIFSGFCHRLPMQGQQAMQAIFTLILTIKQ